MSQTTATTASSAASAPTATKGAKRAAKAAKQREYQATWKACLELIRAANAVDDPLAAFVPFQTYERNGLSLQLRSYHAANLPADVMQWAFSLLKANMQTFYEHAEGWSDAKKRAEVKDDDAHFIVAFTKLKQLHDYEHAEGWSDAKKRAELKDDDARFIVAFTKTEPPQPVAFAHYRFVDEETVESEHKPCVYIYELQLEKSVQRKGLGKFMVQLLELIGRKNNMEWIFITVYKENVDAMAFYTSLKFAIDENSPSVIDQDPYSYSYEIMSKRFPTAGQCAAAALKALRESEKK